MARSTLDRASAVLNAMPGRLNAAGFRLLLLPPETSVPQGKTRRRWWRARKEHHD